MQPLKFINLDNNNSCPAQQDTLNDLVKSFFIAPKHDTVRVSNAASSSANNQPDFDRKATRSRQKANAELDAAIALYKAGMPCKVRKAVVCAVKGWSRATLYRRIAEGKFPRPLKDDRNSWWWISDVFDDP
jgi:hypothetical protein